LNVKKPKEQLDNLEAKITDRNQKEVEMKEKIQPSLFALAAFAILLFGCNPNAKLAQKCAEQYPCEDSLTVREITRTDTVELTDTYIEYLDTTICPPSANGVTVIDIDTVRVPGRKVVITRTVMDSTWYRLDQAALAVMQQDLDEADKAIAKLITEKAVVQAKLKASKKRFGWALGIAIGFFIPFLFGIIRKVKKK
jgi:hypothetical protein